MNQKVLKVGTSIALVVPKDVARELGLKAGDAVVRTTDIKRGAITYTKQKRARPTKQDRIAELTLNFVERYRADLESLKDR